MHDTQSQLPVNGNEVTSIATIGTFEAIFLSHLPSFEFYGFQSLERGQLAIKTIYIYIYIYASNWVGDRPSVALL
jgi:hypothetical protein